MLIVKYKLVSNYSTFDVEQHGKCKQEVHGPLHAAWRKQQEPQLKTLTFLSPP